MPIIRDPSTGALVYDPSAASASQQVQPRQMPVAARSNPGQGVGGLGGQNPLLMLLATLLGGAGQTSRPDAAVQQANAWGNAQGITPENQWDSRWKLLNNNSPLGEWGRASLRQDYGGGQELSSQAPGAGPFLGASQRKFSGTNWESTPSGGGGLAYSGSQIAPNERGTMYYSPLPHWSDPLGGW
jgi:hypothetical protein